MIIFIFLHKGTPGRGGKKEIKKTNTNPTQIYIGLDVFSGNFPKQLICK